MTAELVPGETMTKKRSRGRARRGPFFVLVAGVGLLAFNMSVASDANESGDLFLLLAGVAFTTIGALITARTDGNRVGWVISAAGLILLGSGALGYWADRGSLVAEALGGTLWLSWLLSVAVLIYWFPTGSALSASWRWVGWFGLGCELLVLTYVVSDKLCPGGGDPCEAWVDNPIGVAGIPNPEYGVTAQLTFGLLAAFSLLSLLSLIVRYVRSRGIERLQIKWFTFSVVSVITVIILQGTIENLLSIPEVIGNFVFGLAVLAVPLAVGVAVLRYRLYDIDRIVSRTVSYAVLVAFLVALYAVGVSWLTSLLPDQSQLVVAATTLGVAALFNPVRIRVQAWVDRRFNRSRYDTQRVMDRFTGSLQDQVDIEKVVGGWVGVVSESMQPARVSVWLRKR